ncbi:MAG: hypothetical protein HZB99_01040 [Candidatus Harrisonbacteria bacterium]|nr:hypothetical protein [Candidatus Harrisonbacteria bacterium]
MKIKSEGMKVAIHGRWNKHSSRIGEAKNLWRTRENFDKVLATEDEVRIATNLLTIRFLSLLDKIGVDVISDGGFRWDSAFDIARKIRGSDGLKILHRIPETNHFHRAPEITVWPVWPGPILKEDIRLVRMYNSKPILVSLVGPYTLARQSISRNSHIDFAKLVLAYAEVLHREIAELAKSNKVYVKIDDPQIFSSQIDWSLLRSAYFKLAYGIERSKIFHCTWFRRIRNPKAYFELPFGGFFVDLSDRSAFLRNYAILKYFPKGKILGAGIIDARQPAMLPMEDMLFWMRSVLQRVPRENVWLCPNADLEFLPWDIAEDKLRQLVQLKKEVE